MIMMITITIISVSVLFSAIIQCSKRLRNGNWICAVFVVVLLYYILRFVVLCIKLFKMNTALKKHTKVYIYLNYPDYDKQEFNLIKTWHLKALIIKNSWLQFNILQQLLLVICVRYRLTVLICDNMKYSIAFIVVKVGIITSNIGCKTMLSWCIMA